MFSYNHKIIDGRLFKSKKQNQSQFPEISTNYLYYYSIGIIIYNIMYNNQYDIFVTRAIQNDLNRKAFDVSEVDDLFPK